jgi:hypothetical protein
MSFSIQSIKTMDGFNDINLHINVHSVCTGRIKHFVQAFWYG